MAEANGKDESGELQQKQDPPLPDFVTVEIGTEKIEVKALNWANLRRLQPLLEESALSLANKPFYELVDLAVAVFAEAFRYQKPELANIEEIGKRLSFTQTAALCNSFLELLTISGFLKMGSATGALESGEASATGSQDQAADLGTGTSTGSLPNAPAAESAEETGTQSK